MKKNNVYVSYTPYHILVSLIHSYKIFKKETNNYLIICNHAENNKILCENINADIYWIKKAMFVPDKKINERFSNNFLIRFIKIILISYLYPKYFPEINRFKKIFLNGDTYLFHDSPITSKYLLNTYENFHMIEDGLANYENKQVTFNSILKKFFGVYPSLGRHPKIEKILVKSPNKLPQDIKNKGEKFNVNELANNLSNEIKELVFGTFVEKNNKMKQIKNRKNKILVITQPLSEDKFIDEMKKIELYSKIICEYKDDFDIFIKPHPREKTNYELLNFNNLIVLDKNFPLEVLNFWGENLFDKAITIFSSAINNIQFVKEKIILGKDKLN